MTGLLTTSGVLFRDWTASYRLFSQNRLPLLFEPLDALGNCPQDRQTIEQRGFVVGILGVQRPHGLTIVLIALSLRSRAGISVEGGDGAEVEFIARRRLLG